VNQPSPANQRSNHTEAVIPASTVLDTVNSIPLAMGFSIPDDWSNEESHLNLDFYLNIGFDPKGRSLEDILRKDDRWLEQTHDYIQWLFPLYVGSQFNPNAPLLTDEVRAAFLDSAHSDHREIQKNFGWAIQRMLVFYGYFNGPLNPDQVEPTGEWRNKADNWVSDGNHNYMRISRMLRCMTLLGRHRLAVSFHNALLDAASVHPEAISQRTIGFWNEAVIPVPDSAQ
jgi:Opioid growth factor receptor (OGFr) conserved region